MYISYIEKKKKMVQGHDSYEFNVTRYYFSSASWQVDKFENVLKIAS